MKIKKCYDLFILDEPNRVIEVMPKKQNIVWLCEQDKKIDNFFFTKRVEVNLKDLPEYEIALNKVSDKTKKVLMDKTIKILNLFNNKENIQKYLVV